MEAPELDPAYIQAVREWAGENQAQRMRGVTDLSRCGDNFPRVTTCPRCGYRHIERTCPLCW